MSRPEKVRQSFPGGGIRFDENIIFYI